MATDNTQEIQETFSNSVSCGSDLGLAVTGQKKVHQGGGNCRPQVDPAASCLQGAAGSHLLNSLDNKAGVSMETAVFIEFLTDQEVESGSLALVPRQVVSDVLSTGDMSTDTVSVCTVVVLWY